MINKLTPKIPRIALIHSITLFQSKHQFDFELHEQLFGVIVRDNSRNFLNLQTIVIWLKS